MGGVGIQLLRRGEGRRRAGGPRPPFWRIGELGLAGCAIRSVRGRGTSTGGEAGRGSLVFGGVRRQAAGKTRESEVSQSEVLFLLFV